MEEKTISQAWKARSITGCLLLILAFIGLIITDVRHDGGWFYWRLLIPVYAIASLWLSWYLRKKNHGLGLKLIWQELLHWLGLVLAVLLLSSLVNIGIIGRFEAGLIILIMLALTTFLAGIYTEYSFMALVLCQC